MTQSKQQLEQQLWNIANTLRGKMGADEFRDYILGFIFYKYLSRKMELHADRILRTFHEAELVEHFFDYCYPLHKKVQKNLMEIQKLAKLRDWLLLTVMNGLVTVSDGYEGLENVLVPDNYRKVAEFETRYN